MKKLLLTAAVVTVLTSCSKDEPILEQPQNLTEQTNPESDDEKLDSENETSVSPSLEELKLYCGVTKVMYVYEAINQILSSRGEKLIVGKRIAIHQAKVDTRKEEEGMLSIHVEGTLDGKPFSDVYTLEGLAKKPGSYYMASRANVQWKATLTTSPEKQPIAFDELFRLSKNEKFTAQYLAQWIDIYSSIPQDNGCYKFSEEDLAKTQFSEVNYENGRISFVLTYNGVKGRDSYKERPSLAFDKNEYYKQKVKLNINDVKQYYLQGFYENLESFYGNAIEIEDDNTFVAEMVTGSKSYDSNSNIVSCQLSMYTYTNTDRELARFEFKFEGFKPLTDLKKELVLATTAELGLYMAKRLSNAVDGDVLPAITALPIKNWIKKAQFGVRRGDQILELYCDKARLNDVEVEAWLPVSRRVIYSDILLIAPYFEVISAQKLGNKLVMQIELANVNEVALENVIVPLEVVL